MSNFRVYGEKPYKVAVIHGGPGAAGEMAAVAVKLSSFCGVLEPLQTSKSFDGQIKELKSVIEKEADIPVILVGFSWGSWLVFKFAADYPSYVKKLIMISSGSYEEKYVKKMQKIRLKRLSEKDKFKLQFIIKILREKDFKEKDIVFAKLGQLFVKIDSYSPIKVKSEKIDYSYNIYKNVWKDAAKLRKTGELLKLGEKIQCPVTAIHGDYDSHPAEGVKKPLLSVVKIFKFIMLEKCGHKPWIEKYAKDKFYEVLKKELDL